MARYDSTREPGARRLLENESCGCARPALYCGRGSTVLCRILARETLHANAGGMGWPVPGGRSAPPGACLVPAKHPMLMMLLGWRDGS
jgi:hypothetical protein